MNNRGKHPFDAWDFLGCVIGCAMAVLGLIAIGAGGITLAEKVLCP